MEDHKARFLKAINTHTKLVVACEREFAENLRSVKNIQVARKIGQPQATRLVALEAVRQYAQEADFSAKGIDRGNGVRVMPEPSMARVLAVCAAHVAYQFLGFERD